MSQKLFLRHVDLIQTVVDYVCRKQGFSEDDREDFGSIVNIRMIENDYGILRELSGPVILPAKGNGPERTLQICSKHRRLRRVGSDELETLPATSATPDQFLVDA